MCDRPEKIKHATWIEAHRAWELTMRRDYAPERLHVYECDDHYHVGHQEKPLTKRQRLRLAWRARRI